MTLQKALAIATSSAIIIYLLIGGLFAVILNSEIKWDVGDRTAYPINTIDLQADFINSTCGEYVLLATKEMADKGHSIYQSEDNGPVYIYDCGKYKVESFKFNYQCQNCEMWTIDFVHIHKGIPYPHKIRVPSPD